MTEYLANLHFLQYCFGFNYNDCCIKTFTVKPQKLEYPQRHKICLHNRCFRIYLSHLSSIAYFLGSG